MREREKEGINVIEERGLGCLCTFQNLHIG